MLNCIRKFTGSLLFVLLAFHSHQGWTAGTAISADYKLPASVDPEITSDVETEVWGTLWRPKVLNKSPYPLVLLLHGNHATCGHFDPSLGVRIDDRIDYTFTGTCPAGYVVTPNHRGYDYLAEQLASLGYVVVSINANRGITAADGFEGDQGLNLRRGRLVLKHLELLSRWNRSGGGRHPSASTSRASSTSDR